MGLILITHDMGVVAETADRVVVQYAGRQVESNTTLELFSDPHPVHCGAPAALPERAEGHARWRRFRAWCQASSTARGRLSFAALRIRHRGVPSREPAVAREEMGLARCHTPLTHGRITP